MALEHTFNDYWWLAVPKIYDKESAIKRFIERFGRQPDEVREDHQLYWIGPANERNSENVCLERGWSHERADIDAQLRDMIETNGGNETLDNVAD